VHTKGARTTVAITLTAFALFVMVAGYLIMPPAPVAQTDTRATEVCLDCHEDAAGQLEGTLHQILPGDIDNAEAMIACTDCHLGDERHWDDDPEEYPMTNPSKVPSSMAATICSKCHVKPHQQNMMEGNVHALNDVSCTKCHQVHGNTHARLLQDDEPELCYRCHTHTRGEFNKPFRHPVWDGIVRCSECHMMIAETQKTRLWFRGVNAACAQCHPDMVGPFPYEHQATIDWSTQEGGCITCHEAHGSYQPRMLRQPYTSPNYQTCTQCHSVPGHNNNPYHGTQWAGVPCNDCHVDIHGSFTNSLFVSQSLMNAGCFNAGCHQL
jgi:DmsE family decaheme c-type cytochrome